MLHASRLIIPVHLCVCSLQGNIVLRPKYATVSFVISVSVVTFITHGGGAIVAIVTGAVPPRVRPPLRFTLVYSAADESGNAGEQEVKSMDVHINQIAARRRRKHARRQVFRRLRQKMKVVLLR